MVAGSVLRLSSLIGSPFVALNRRTNVPFSEVDAKISPLLFSISWEIGPLCAFITTPLLCLEALRSTYVDTMTVPGYMCGVASMILFSTHAMEWMPFGLLHVFILANLVRSLNVNALMNASKPAVQLNYEVIHTNYLQIATSGERLNVFFEIYFTTACRLGYIPKLDFVGRK